MKQIWWGWLHNKDGKGCHLVMPRVHVVAEDLRLRYVAITHFSSSWCVVCGLWCVRVSSICACVVRQSNVN